MNAYVRGVQAAFGALLVAVGIWSCTATRTASGEIYIEFAPDMTITALGLEDALSDLTALLGACTGGTFGRPCTPDELSAIERAMERVVRAKERVARSGAASTRMS